MDVDSKGEIDMEKDKKVIPNKIPREVLRVLENTLGDEWVSEDRAVIETYSRFSVDSAGTLRQHGKWDDCLQWPYHSRSYYLCPYEQDESCSKYRRG